eukprot:3028655-Prymnesium_polylepis.1
MLALGHTCSTWWSEAPGECIGSADWIANLWCERDCDASGRGYSGVACCAEAVAPLSARATELEESEASREALEALEALRTAGDIVAEDSDGDEPPSDFGVESADELLTKRP